MPGKGLCRKKRGLLSLADEVDRTKMIEAPRRVIQRVHYPLEVMLVCVRWYATYPLSFRNIEQRMVERGVLHDHSTLHRWFIMLLSVLAATLARGRSELGNRRDLRESECTHHQYVPKDVSGKRRKNAKTI